MGRKADALRVVNVQTGEWYGITREMIGIEDGSSIGIEVRMIDDTSTTIRSEPAANVQDAHDKMVELASEAALRLLALPRK